MTIKQTLAFSLLAFSLSTGIALAAELPANVKSLQSQRSGGEITVLWSQVPGAVSYRVYFSQKSILANAGNYDDFEQTTDAQTVYVFKTAPLKSGKIYFGVLAVDKDGKESEGFETESFVDAPVVSSSSSSSSSAPASSLPSTSSSVAMPSGESPTTTAIPMGIESVAVVSATGVLVTFRKDVSPSVTLRSEAFLITTLSGTLLPIEKVVVSGKKVLLTTRLLTADTEYILGLRAPIQAVDGTNATPSEPQVRFKTSVMGTSTAPDQNYGRNPALPGPTSETPKPKPTDPSNLGLSAVLRKDGNYNITARWNPSPDAAQYALYTSKNNDAYAWNSVVQGGETTVQYSRVSPGSFGVRVASRTDNGESAGVEKVITLPATGIGLLGIAAVAGLGAGRRLQRKKKEMV